MKNPPGVSDWTLSNSVASRLLITTAGCVAIAVLLWALVPSIGENGFIPVLVHSQLIGLSISSLTILAHRYLLAESSTRPAFVGTNAVCSVVGLFAGMVIARIVLGLPLLGEHWFDSRDALIATMATTVAASLVFVAHRG